MKRLAVALCCLASACAAPLKGRTYTAAEIRADLKQFVEVVAATHPRVGYSTDVTALYAAAERLDERIREPLTARSAWALLAELNPLFRDAHTGLQYPVNEFEAYRKEGGAVFPVPVYVDYGGVLRAAEGVDPQLGIAASEEIVSINDILVRGFLQQATPLMRGETDLIRQFVLTHNFAAYWWTLHGPQPSYRVTVRNSGAETREIALPHASEPARGQAGTAAFHYERLRHDAGYLDVPSFDPALKSNFADFLQRSFAEIKAGKLSTLVIDLRRNPGGAHELSDELTGYLAAKPVRLASRLVARVTPANRDLAPAAAVGDVVEIPWDEWLKPAANPLRFGGDVFLLIGRRTYSQAIVFAAMFQDFGLGTIVGEATDGWANQTGQVQMTPLAHSGLKVAVPLYIITRPSGDLRPRGVRPDRVVADEPGKPRLMIERLLDGRGPGGKSHNSSQK